VVEGDRVRDVTGVLDRLPSRRWPGPPGDALIAGLAGLRPAIEGALPEAPALPLARVTLRSPVARPGKVVAVRGNYRGAGDGGAVPELFLKAGSSVAGPGDGIALRFADRRVDHEVELVAVIGRRIECAAVPEALDAVAGWCVGIDVTLRGAEDRGLRKSLDGYTVLGPWLTTADAAAGLADAAIELAVNGVVRQRARSPQLVLAPAAIIAEASRWFALEPGDVVMTGTPPGVGPLASGDVIDCSIEGLGAMRVAVR
jgi:2-keto-4-pentenoate hydratase/2-oxohepta-3-ene-1,7-dioic acid hydratase in catechol pathway